MSRDVGVEAEDVGAVAEADVEHAVGSEREVATIVIELRPGGFHQGSIRRRDGGFTADQGKKRVRRGDRRADERASRGRYR